MASLYDKLLHLIGPGGWELGENGNTGVPEIQFWRRPGNPPNQAAIDAVTDAQADAAAESRDLDRGFNLSRKDKVLVKWIASRTGGGTPASILAELRAIWRNTI